MCVHAHTYIHSTGNYLYVLAVMMEGCPYEVTSTERVINEEKQLDAELTELKAKIEENELVYGIRRPRNVRWGCHFNYYEVKHPIILSVIFISHVACGG